MYTDGQIITKSEYLEFANWTNANGNKFIVTENGDGTYTVREVVVVEPTEEEKIQARIAELKQLLADTDYAIIKIAEGSATQEEYADLIAQRKAWREEINQLGV